MKRKLKQSMGILLSVLMTATMIPVLPVAAASNPFKDVRSSDWFYDSVQYVYDNGLMNGVSNNTFEPQTTMSRAMVVTVLYRMEVGPFIASFTFKDVPANTWYTEAVAWASSAGVVNGYSSEKFGPSDNVTREQIATILYRYAVKKGYDISESSSLKGYNDYDKISDWAKEALEWANQEGLIVGIGNNTLAPSNNATRAQVATILMRFCENIVRNENVRNYTVTYDYNYDNMGIYRIVKVREGETVDIIQDPERDNYTFSGWYWDQEGTEEFDDSEDIFNDITLYAHWLDNNDGLTKPDKPSDADNYYWANSEKVLDVKNVKKSEETFTEDDIISLMEDRGFDSSEVIFDYSIDGEYIDGQKARIGNTTKHPMYRTAYVTDNGDAWAIFIVDGDIFASPIFYNLDSTLESELLISETETTTCYDDETNTFYVTVPNQLGATVKIVERIDADTLNSLTKEEIDNL